MKKITKSIVMMMVIIVTLVSTSVKIDAKSTCAASGCSRDACTGGRYCRMHTCEHDGCYSYNDRNGTIYCNTHAAEYVRKAGYTPCSVSGCYDRRRSGSSYCSTHECKKSDCHNKKASGSDYCSTHNPSNRSSSSSSNTSRRSSASSSRSSSFGKKYDQYDVYSYSNAQSFADDKYEEFYDYEDDYEDEDEAYDAAEDYWRAHH